MAKKNSEILGELNLGSSVAENDENLTSYFVPTLALKDFVADRYDIIRGVKGSGKSAILKVVSSEPKKHEALADVRLTVATEHSGEPAFKRAFELLKVGEINEVALVNAWKTYLVNLALDAVEALPQNSETRAAVSFALKSGLRFRTKSTFKKIWWSLLRFFSVKSFTMGQDSVAAEFPDTPPEFWVKNEEVVDFPEAIRLCVAAFESQSLRCWLLIDRLDAAFQENLELERNALRALLLAYKDFMGNRALRAKLFFRTDLFEQVTTGAGFRELTHVLDRTSPAISWDQDKLLHMIMERFAFNESICEKFGFTKNDVRDGELRQAAFFSIFPNQIDVGPRKPDTWNWMCARIRDGNNVRTPRDMQILVQNSARKQAELLSLGGDEASVELIGAQAVKAGLAQLSSDKVNTALIAENSALETAIRAFHRQKAEQNSASLQDLLGQEWRHTVDLLIRVGFLEKTGETWKVPMLYRDGLEIVQGAAFEKGVEVDVKSNKQ